MALSRHHAALNRPRSVTELVEEARSFEFNTARTLQQWIRSGKMLLTEAVICEEEGNIQMAYLYMYRHAELVISKLPEHPEYKDPRFRGDLTGAQKAVQKNLLKLEQWKPRINQDHQRYVKAMEKRRAERQQIQNEYDELQVQRRSHECQSQFTAQNLQTRENREAAVGMALRELQRRGISSQTTVEQNVAPRANSETPLAAHSDGYGHPESQLSDDIRRAARHLYQPYPTRNDSRAFSSDYTPSTYTYPTVPIKEGTMDWRTPTVSPPASMDNGPPPAVPRKTLLHDTAIPELPAAAPPLPGKEAVHPSPISNQVGLSGTASTSEPAITSLRPLIIPPSLAATFTQIASPNTRRDLETCGILAGTLLSTSSTLALTHLILPEQTATPNTCDTTAAGDAALFDYCDNNRLLVLGWIHTHPSQTCFLSSRDLHTSAGYQTMLPEAIAIVCAPRHAPSVGIFRLTDPPGLETIVKCTREGTFHPHPDVEGGIYTDANAGESTQKEPWKGHVVVADGLKLEVVDLRGKS